MIKPSVIAALALIAAAIPPASPRHLESENRMKQRQAHEKALTKKQRIRQEIRARRKSKEQK